MQDRPDLSLELETEIIYAEVKHHNAKETDQRVEAKMAKADQEGVAVRRGCAEYSRFRESQRLD
jgi:hypothetical protein